MSIKNVRRSLCKCCGLRTTIHLPKLQAAVVAVIIAVVSYFVPLPPSGL